MRMQIGRRMRSAFTCQRWFPVWVSSKLTAPPTSTAVVKTTSLIVCMIFQVLPTHFFYASPKSVYILCCTETHWSTNSLYGCLRQNGPFHFLLRYFRRRISVVQFSSHLVASNGFFIAILIHFMTFRFLGFCFLCHRSKASMWYSITPISLMQTYTSLTVLRSHLSPTKRSPKFSTGYIFPFCASLCYCSLFISFPFNRTSSHLFGILYIQLQSIVTVYSSS